MKAFYRSFSAVLAAVMILSALCVWTVSADDSGAITVKAESIIVEEGQKTARIGVSLTDLGKNGCCSCKFRVTFGNGVTVASTELTALSGNYVAEIINDGKTASYMWVGGDLNTVYFDTLVMTIVVNLPSNLKDGDEIAVTVIPSSDPDDFLVYNEDDGVGGKGVDGTISVVRSLKNVLHLKAESVSVRAGESIASVGVTLANVNSSLGASSCKFTLSVPGAKVTTCESCFVNGNVQFNAVNDTLVFAWVGGQSNAVYSDTVVARFTVELSKGLSAGDSLDIIITVDRDRENYLDASGEIGLGAVAENGKLSIVSAGSITITAKDVVTEISSESFDVEIFVSDIPDVGLSSCKFNVRIEGAEPIAVTPKGVTSEVIFDITNGVASFFWVKGGTPGLYADTLLATVTFKLSEGVKIGDELMAAVGVSSDPDNYLADADQQIGLGAYHVNGKVSVVGHSLTHYEYTKPHLGQNGHIEYWQCELCGKCFTDSEGNFVADPASLLLLVGDVTQDGRLNAKDVILLMRVIIGTKTADPDYADFNGDGKVNAKDVTGLMKYLTSF